MILLCSIFLTIWGPATQLPVRRGFLFPPYPLVNRCLLSCNISTDIMGNSFFRNPTANEPCSSYILLLALMSNYDDHLEANSKLLKISWWKRRCLLTCGIAQHCIANTFCQQNPNDQLLEKWLLKFATWLLRTTELIVAFVCVHVLHIVTKLYYGLSVKCHPKVQVLE